jgi:diguanylate cyclase (GGDEF)-like protein
VSSLGCLLRGPPTGAFVHRQSQQVGGLTPPPGGPLDLASQVQQHNYDEVHEDADTGPETGEASPPDEDSSRSRRNQSADDRDRTAEARDSVSESHDRASEARDEMSDERDRRAEVREQDAPAVDLGAVSDRYGAKRDRRGGAGDRVFAADDREAASKDRMLSAQERAASSIDELTGAHRRGPGLVELSRDITRARRMQTPFAIAFVDVDHLKETNDTLGHAAGDQLLRRVVDIMRAHLRDYDLIIRFGGDEFLCSQDVDADRATQRFSDIVAALAAANASVTVGIAALEAHDSPQTLIERADAALRAERKQRETMTE